MGMGIHVEQERKRRGFIGLRTSLRMERLRGRGGLLRRRRRHHEGVKHDGIAEGRVLGSFKGSVKGVMMYRLGTRRSEILDVCFLFMFDGAVYLYVSFVRLAFLR